MGWRVANEVQSPSGANLPRQEAPMTVAPQTVGSPAGPQDSPTPAKSISVGTRAGSDSIREHTRVLAFDESGALLCKPSPEAVGRGRGRPNAVRNSRFTPLTWLPKSLFEQFHRAANVFFLCVSVLVFIEPVISWFTCTAFFVGVLLWTALKDLYEDLKKRRDDDAENSRSCQRYDPAARSFVQVQWRDILAGDLILSLQDEALPADALIVQASDEQAFVSTMNLDGETNLKERNPDQLLAVLTSAGGGAPGRFSVAEAARSAAALFQQGLELQLEEPQAALGEIGGSVKVARPSEATAKAMAFLRSGEDTSAPGPGPELRGNVSQDNFVLRGCVLRNTSLLLSVVAYVGDETKTWLNMSTREAKRSKMQRSLNLMVQGLVTTLLMFLLYVTISASAQGFDGEPQSWRSMRLAPEDWAPTWVRRIMWYWIILYQVVPISLYVCFEIMKLVLGYQVGADPQMVDPETKRGALARTADLMEEMGQIDFIFSDKTGTLTENEMVFAQCCVHGRDFGDFRGEAAGALGPPGVQAMRQILGRQPEDEQRAGVRWFFLCLAACHSAQVDSDQLGSYHFSGSSPDEVAFLEAAQRLGVVLTGRRRLPGGAGTDLTVEMPGEGTLTLTLLGEIPFSADRKRMSVLCRFGGALFCICKGADSVLGPLCGQTFDGNSSEHLSMYSKLGLRTLAFASRPVPLAEFEDWQKKLSAALVRKGDKEEAMARVAAEMEHSLTLCGITAIEDKLQEGVTEAIVSLKAAGIRFGVLTGDKTETAVEIVRACRLFTESTTLAYMTDVQSAEQAKEQLEAATKSLRTATEGGLVLDGTFVSFAVESDELRCRLYELFMATSSCVCCRLSPSQKRKLVELVKQQNAKGVTLAIGDGANDVAMIQSAHVGIGLWGKEGNAAVLASDVAISKFRFLVPLVFCHGRRAYRRMAVFLLYMLYKHIAIATGDMIWASQSNFSGDVGYPEWLNSAYAGSITPFAFYVTLGFDCDVPDAVALRSPEIYVEGRMNLYFNSRVFAFWIASAVFHGTVAWLVPSLTVGSSDTESADFWTASVASFMILVLLVNARLWIMSLNPFYLRTVLVMSLSFLLAFACVFVLSETSLGQAMQPRMAGAAVRAFTQGGSLAVMAATGLVVVLLDLLLIQGRRVLRPCPLDEARARLGGGGGCGLRPAAGAEAQREGT